MKQLFPYLKLKATLNIIILLRHQQLMPRSVRYSTADLLCPPRSRVPTVWVFWSFFVVVFVFLLFCVGFKSSLFAFVMNLLSLGGDCFWLCFRILQCLSRCCALLSRLRKISSFAVVVIIHTVTLCLSSSITFSEVHVVLLAFQDCIFAPFVVRFVFGSIFNWSSIQIKNEKDPHLIIFLIWLGKRKHSYWE